MRHITMPSIGGQTHPKSLIFSRQLLSRDHRTTPESYRTNLTVCRNFKRWVYTSQYGDEATLAQIAGSPDSSFLTA
jgi:hypothetical protein